MLKLHVCGCSAVTSTGCILHNTQLHAVLVCVLFAPSLICAEVMETEKIDEDRQVLKEYGRDEPQQIMAEEDYHPAVRGPAHQQVCFTTVV